MNTASPQFGKYIPKSGLKHGAYYRGRCRNSCIARWDSVTAKFYYWREKLGDIYTEAIEHPEDFNGFDVFTPRGEVQSRFHISTTPGDALPKQMHDDFHAWYSDMLDLSRTLRQEDSE